MYAFPWYHLCNLFRGTNIFAVVVRLVRAWMDGNYEAEFNCRQRFSRKNNASTIPSTQISCWRETSKFEVSCWLHEVRTSKSFAIQKANISLKCTIKCCIVNCYVKHTLHQDEPSEVCQNLVNTGVKWNWSSEILRHYWCRKCGCSYGPKSVDDCRGFTNRL